VECALRESAPADLRLIETFRWEPGAGFVRLPAHLARLARGAAALAVPLKLAAVERALAGVGAAAALRVRLTVALDGTPAVETAPLPAPLPAGKPEWRVRVAEARLASGDPWLRLKTTERRIYDGARDTLPADIDEVLFLNERGEVCDGTITSVFVARSGALVTPPLRCGLLPGVLREEMLAEGLCREAVLRREDLAEGLMVGNSLRGLIPARLA
jgi:4-amino-4-deoxychorismate lyase